MGKVNSRVRELLIFGSISESLLPVNCLGVRIRVLFSTALTSFAIFLAASTATWALLSIPVPVLPAIFSPTSIPSPDGDAILNTFLIVDSIPVANLVTIPKTPPFADKNPCPKEVIKLIPMSFKLPPLLNADLALLNKLPKIVSLPKSFLTPDNRLDRWFAG